MRVIFVLFVVVSASLSGCFGADEIFEEERGMPGGLALACLQDDKFTKMKIHFLFENGYDPVAMELVKTRLNQECDKPNGVQIVAREVDFSEDNTWSADDVRDARWKHGDDAMVSNTLNWYLLFPKGTYDDDSVLGVAVDASTVAVFKDSIDESENFLGRPSAEEIERAVTVHEVGHLLGLVNLVYQSPIDHEDPDHPGHSSNDESVMYWAIESSSIGNIFSGSIPDEFDADDKSDLRGMANGDLECSNQLWP
tara:strand:- start:2650 stop:3408 length:759 start_codon:yes stop_codon:yes gene_type:complete